MKTPQPQLEYLFTGPPLRRDAPLPSFDELLQRAQTQGDLQLVGEDQLGRWELRAPQIIALRDVLLQLKAATPDIHVILVRTPYANDAPLAACALAALAAGISVGLPTAPSVAQLEAWLQQRPHATIIADLAPLHPTASANMARHLSESCARHGATLVDLRALLQQSSAAERAVIPTQASEIWFTTSGTTSTPKRIGYEPASLLLHALAQDQAGLLAPERLGGPSLNPLLSHSMGMRDVVHALWCRRRALFITPEWLEERPYKIVEQIKRWPFSHITCGPGLLRVIRLYLERFPMLEQTTLKHVRCIVSSGAQAQPELFEGLPSHVLIGSAFGMTEAQQLSHTLLHGAPADTLGAPLPGASVGLVKLEDWPGSLGVLVRAPWAAATINGEPAPAWIDTKDLVSADKLGRWRWVGRQDEAIQSTGLGLKLNLSALEQRYRALDERLKDLILLAPPQLDTCVGLLFGQAQDEATRQQLRAVLEAAHERWSSEDPAAQLGAYMSAMAILPEHAPTQGIGKLNKQALLTDYRALIDALGSPYLNHHAKLELCAPTALTDAHAPRLTQLFKLAGLDWEYMDGRGDTLIAQRATARVEVTDWVGGYGANLLGHRDEAILEAAHQALHRGLPTLDQGSARQLAAKLAAKLNLIFGEHTKRSYVVSLASTGAEAVELALKHALLEREQRVIDHHAALKARWGATASEQLHHIIEHNLEQLRQHRPKLIALEHAFHGKSAGALHALEDQAQRSPFAPLLGLETIFIPAQDEAAAKDRLEDTIAQAQLDLLTLDPDTMSEAAWSMTNILAALIEPIQGEGGVRVVSPAIIAALKGRGFPLISDEIQCGLGRAGRWVASLPTVADYYIVGKSLGGGVAKLSALLIEKPRYVPRFDELKSSTFSEDSYSCAVGLRALEALEQHQVCARADEAGQQLERMLRTLQEAHPEVIAHVEGRGLMWGLTLALPARCEAVVLRAMAERGLGYLAAAYLLNVHHQRMMPTLSAPDTLRLEPSLHIQPAQIERLGQALKALVQALEAGNLFELLAHATGASEAALAPHRQLAAHFIQQQDPDRFTIERQAPAPEARRVAFIHNPVHTTKLLLADAPPFALLKPHERLELIDRYVQLLELGPMRSFSRNLYGGKVWLEGITMAATPAILDHLRRTGDTKLILAQLERALEMAHEDGCQVAVLGAQTSVVSRSGQAVLAPQGLQVTTGNALTAALAMRALERAALSAGLPLKTRDAAPKLKLGIVGALGNIGSAIAAAAIHDLGWQVELLLLGRQGSQARLEVARKRLLRLAPDAQISCATDPSALMQCTLILATVSSAEPVIRAEHIAQDRQVFIADISEPEALEAQLQARRPDATILHPGLLKLPQDPDFMLSAHSPRGEVFACAAEGILLGLEPQPQLKLVGELDGEVIKMMQTLSERYALA